MNGSANPMGLPIEWRQEPTPPNPMPEQGGGWRHEPPPPNPTTGQGGGGGGFGEQRGLDGGRNEWEGGIDLQGDDDLWQLHPHPQAPMVAPTFGGALAANQSESVSLISARDLWPELDCY